MKNITHLSNNRKTINLLLITILIGNIFHFNQYGKTAADFLHLNNSINNYSWTEPVNISSIDDIGSFDHDIAIDSNGNVYIVWYEKIDLWDEIMCRKYNSKNKSWSPIDVVSNTSSNLYSNYPKISIDSNDYIHLVWRDVSPYSLKYRYFNGSSWSTIYEFASCNEVYTGFDVASDSQNVYFVWNDKIDTNFDLFFRSFSIYNKNFTNSIRLTNNSWRSDSPQLFINSDELIHLIWTDKGINYNKSEIWYNSFDGETWSNQTMELISNDDNYRSEEPVLVVDTQDNLYCSWEDYIDFGEVHFRSKINNTWENEIKLSNTSASSPDMYLDLNNTIHIVWLETKGVAYKRLLNQMNWSDISYPINDDSIILSPNVVVDSNNVILLIWNDYTRNNMWELYFSMGFISQNNSSLIFISIFIPLSLLIIVIVIVVNIITKRKYKL